MWTRETGKTYCNESCCVCVQRAKGLKLTGNSILYALLPRYYCWEFWWIVLQQDLVPGLPHLCLIRLHPACHQQTWVQGTLRQSSWIQTDKQCRIMRAWFSSFLLTVDQHNQDVNLAADKFQTISTHGLLADFFARFQNYAAEFLGIYPIELVKNFSLCVSRHPVWFPELRTVGVYL